MAGAVIGQRGFLAVAEIGGARATGAEAAALRRIERRRQVALQHDAPARSAPFGSGTGMAESRACE